MKSYQYLFFDWDGCLAKTLDLWFDIFKIELAKYNLHPTDEVMCSMIGDFYTGSLKAGIKPEEYIEFKKKVYSHIDLKINSEGAVLYEGAKQMLKDLKSKGKTIALISSGSGPYIEKMLTMTGTKEYFNLIISGSDVEQRKPSPEGIVKALAKLGSEKHNAIMIGDSSHDLDAAKNAGIDSVLFFPDTHSFFYDIESLKKSSPTYTIGTFEELKKIVDP